MLETNLERMASHLEFVLSRDREIITTENNELAFKKCYYGEPTAILEWPLLSVVPIDKSRELHATRKYRIGFEIHLILYHGEVADTKEIQRATHRRAEAVERYILSDRKWNFEDTDDSDKDRVIHGWVNVLDHPLVFMGQESLWRSSRLQLQAISEEMF